MEEGRGKEDAGWNKGRVIDQELLLYGKVSSERNHLWDEI